MLSFCTYLNSYETVFPVQDALVLVAVVCLGHAPLDAHARPHAAHQVVVPHRQRRLARREVRVEVVDDAGQTRARGQQTQVPHGGQAVPRVPRLQTVIPEVKDSIIPSII